MLVQSIQKKVGSYSGKKERRDENGNDVPTSVCTVAILGKEAVVNEILKCQTKYGLSKEFEITKTVLAHPEA